MGQDTPMVGVLAGGSGYSYGGGASRWVMDIPMLGVLAGGTWIFLWWGG